MGVFDDIKLEQLDWMSQMTETIESDLNELLAQLPDRTIISVQDIIDSSGSQPGISVGNVIRKIKKDYEQTLTWEENAVIKNCFKFEVEGEDVEFDLENETITGKIYLVKTTSTLSDEVLQAMMGDRGLQLISARYLPENDPSLVERLNEILDILGNCGDALKGKSRNNKLRTIKDRLDEIFKKNEWRIRDMNLANKVSAWIMDYLKHGDMSCLVNLTKLKVMTHSNMPIYSIKEEQ